MTDSTAFYNKRRSIARYASLMVGLAVFLSKRKSQHFAYGKILAFCNIELVEGRMYEVRLLYLDLPMEWKQVIIRVPLSPRAWQKPCI